MYEELMDELIKLRKILNQNADDKLKVLEAYEWFVAKKGRDCTYSKKCVQVFKKDMYAAVKEQIDRINRLISQGWING